MINNHDFKDFHYNILGSQSTLRGEIKLSGDTILKSFIEGNIEVSGHGKLVLERGSRVKGNIKAIDLEIFGDVDGEIHCSGVVSIRSSAHVQGRIKSNKLVIYPGAIVELEAHSGHSS